MAAAPAPSLFDGMSNEQLQAALSAAQTAYIDLTSGQKGVTFSYSQGEGARSVTYTQTNMAQLTMLIRQLQQALGVAGVQRRPRRMLYL